MKSKILIAMSGGVDSSVAAALLTEQGYDVAGAYMKNWINEVNVFGNCPWQQDIEDARSVADKLGIEFHVVNLMQDYRERVVRYLLDGYESGITPNPDVMCNREMKFGVFLDWALEHGFGAVATGHYARRQQLPDGSWALLEGADKNKDQSYFLALLQQKQIAHARFPIGDLQKPEVRKIAERYGLSTAGKKDSQGICFIGEVRMSDFLKTYLKDDPGAIVDPHGKKLGTHRGLHFYTLGQRRGHGIASPVAHHAYVVVEKRKASNELVIDLETGQTPHLYAQDCYVGNLSFTNQLIGQACTLLTRPRYRAPASAVDIDPQADGRWKLHFHTPQRALAPGQICAFYDGEQLVAGGVFQTILYPESVPDNEKLLAKKL